MSDMSTVFLLAALMLYLIATVLYLMFFKTQKNDLGFWASVMSVGGWSVLTLTLGFRIIISGHAPLSGYYDTLLLFLWAATFIYLVAEVRLGLKAAGTFYAPVVTLALVYLVSLPSQVDSLLPVLESPWVTLHVSLNFIGYGAFAVACLSAILYILQEKQLKAKKFTFMHFQLPDLETLDTLSARLVVVGLPLLTLGMITGAIWANEVWGAYWQWDPKQTWSLAIWAFYAIYCLARYLGGWKGRRAAMLTVVAFIAVVFNYFGVNLFTQGVHNFMN